MNVNMNDIKLIENVRMYKELYDTRHLKYNDSTHKDIVWRNIGLEISQTGSACKLRWICIRDRFRRILKQRRSNIEQSTSKFNRKYKYEDILSFLVPFFKIQEQLTESTILDQYDEGSNEHDITNEFLFDESPLSTTSMNFSSRKSPESISSTLVRKNELETPSSNFIHGKESSSSVSFLQNTQNTTNELKSILATSLQRHPIDMFFDGLAATVKTFSPELQHKAKSKIFSIVSDLEWQHLQNTNETQQYIHDPEMDPTSSVDNVILFKQSLGSIDQYYEIVEGDDEL